jgi:hypothetical protein
MSKYQQFIFESYTFDAASKTLDLHYSFDSILNFTETYRFDFDFINYNPEALDRAFQLLFFVAGVSYYKTYMAPSIVVKTGAVDSTIAAFLGQTYERGLGEFFFVNKLDPKTTITFPATTESVPQLDVGNQTGLLIGLGGGKDSLLSAELLRDQPKVATWSLNHRTQLEPLVARADLPHYYVERTWDEQLKALNDADALNGHVPISAIFACVGTIVSILTGFRDAVVSNESSASEPTMDYQGVAINHQYSKSLDFERSYQTVLAHCFGDSSRYYSLLRPFTELRIAELFSEYGFEKYQDVFSSCNRAYTHDQTHMSWCGECAKCAFVFLIFTPFIERAKLEALWGGKNLLLDPAHHETYLQLLGIAGDKPFDCVGEVKESRAAMRLAQDTYPELDYAFELPQDYDFRAWSKDSIPAELFLVLQAKLS